MAEREGFEPSKGYSPLLVFKTSAFNRSATSPNILNFLISNIITIPEHHRCVHSTVDSTLPVPRYFVPLPLTSVSKSVPDRFTPHIHVFHPEVSAFGCSNSFQMNLSLPPLQKTREHTWLYTLRKELIIFSHFPEFWCQYLDCLGLKMSY